MSSVILASTTMTNTGSVNSAVTREIAHSKPYAGVQMNDTVVGMSFQLTSEQLELKELARRFAYEDARPVGAEIDRSMDPSATYPSDLLIRADELGLRTCALPAEYGGFDIDCLTEVILLEELAAGENGFCNLLPWREGVLLAKAARPAAKERYLPQYLDDPTYMVAYAITEAHAGSDHALGYADDLAAGVQTRAVVDGDEWVINGAKELISNINNAQLIFLFVRTDPTVPWTEGVSLILVPGSTPGVSVNGMQDKLGNRTSPNGFVVFEDVRVPLDNLLGEVNKGLEVVERYSRGSLVTGAARCVGMARAAYEEAVAWTHQRKQGGKLLFEHQSVAHELANIATNIEAARTLVWRAAWAVDHDPTNAARLEDMAKLKATELVADAPRRSMELLGAVGIDNGARISKIVRDALTSLHAPLGRTAMTEHLARVLEYEYSGTGANFRGGW